MNLTSKISSYDPNWPRLFEIEKARIEPGFRPELVCVHHVGSTAVPGLSAKPEIDMMLEVSVHQDEASRDLFMDSLGYVRGSNLSDGHHFYRRDVNGERTHKVHVCLRGHAQILRMLRFRDLLRSDPIVRQQYQDLKLELEKDNRNGIAEYLARKAPFIDACMARFE